MASDKSGLRVTPVMHIALSLVIAITFLISPLRGQHPLPEYDLAMYADPALVPLEYQEQFPAGLVQLWLKALQRPDAELRRTVIDSIAIAHRRGIEDVEQTIPRLVTLLQIPGQSIDVSRAVIAALIEMDQRDQASTLAAMAAGNGPVFSQIVEPALAKWRSPVMKDAWLSRVTRSTATQTMMIHAINGLAALNVSEATDELESLLLGEGQKVPVRIAAARALGMMDASGVVELAGTTWQDPSISSELRPLLVIELLSRQDDTKTVELLNEIVRGSNSALQSRALARLFQIDYQIVDGLADQLLTSEDVNVRRWCARAMIKTQARDRIPPLAALLGDINPSLRREVTGALIELAQQAELRELIPRETMQVLLRDQWQGCEQAAVVLARLDHQASGPRLVELLGHDRAEVQVASAWALKQLAIEDLLPDMLEHAESVYAGFRTGRLHHFMFGPSLKMAHLFIAFGSQRYRPAEDLMRKYLPKDFSLGLYPRAAAAWAMGMLYEDDSQEDLVEIFMQRLADVAGQFPETKEMRRMSAVSLGRMRSESALAHLRLFASGPSEISRICYWSIERISGEGQPVFEPIIVEINDWLLAPLRPAASGR